MEQAITPAVQRAPWNKGRLIGQKPPLRLKEIWAIRIRLQLAKQARELALFNLALDSKLRACDLVSLRVCDVTQGQRVASRAMVLQHKTQRPVQFELTEQTREAISSWLKAQLETTSVPVSEPLTTLAASFHASIQSDHQAMGRLYRP